jgi:cytochrome P450
MSAAVGMLDSIRIKELEASRNEFMNFLMGLVGQRRKEPRDDLLTFIINHELDAFKRTLHERELAGMLTTLLMGGTETTLNMICSGMWLLLEHPKVMQEIQEDHSLIPQFVEEALRIESPVQGLSRQAIQDTEINGTLIPKGSFIWVMYAAANRDPKNWNQPDDFNIHREELKQTMAFGKYVHYCIGAPLARMEARIAFTSLLTRLQNIHFSEKNDFTHGASHVIRGFKEMWLDFEKN